MALETADKGQAVSFNVFLAGVYALMARYPEAESLLMDSLHFYLTSGDELSVFAIRIHLAYIHLKTNRTVVAEENLNLALAWASEWNVDYFPHWWHPLIVAEVCVHALVAEIHVDMAERMLVMRVQEQALLFLRGLLTHSAPKVRQRAVDALSMINGAPLAQIIQTDDERVWRAITDLITDGTLQEVHLGRLAHLLTPARQQATINGVLLATFGFYVQGMTRREIAQYLGRSESTIRNHITLIYECFGLEDNGSRHARRQHLIDLARSEGLIGK